jgi:hypothetical protein
MTASLEKAEAIGLPVEQLGHWYDVDDAESFDLLLAEFAGRRPEGVDPGVEAGPGRATRALLAGTNRGPMAPSA